MFLKSWGRKLLKAHKEKLALRLWGSQLLRAHKTKKKELMAKKKELLAKKKELLAKKKALMATASSSSTTAAASSTTAAASSTGPPPRVFPRDTYNERLRQWLSDDPDGPMSLPTRPDASTTESDDADKVRERIVRAERMRALGVWSDNA
jgi:hypothetical protein